MTCGYFKVNTVNFRLKISFLPSFHKFLCQSSASSFSKLDSSISNTKESGARDFHSIHPSIPFPESVVGRLLVQQTTLDWQQQHL